MTRTTRVISGYQAFGQVRGELLDLVDGLAGAVGELGQRTLGGQVADLRHRVLRDDFSVVFMGEFNAGKSTLVNALLGEKVLPAKGWPTTAVLTVVTWGEERAVTLHPLAADARPLAVAPEELVHHITIDADGTSPRTWERAEVAWPLELCRNNVRIVDSPGLNEDPERSRITLRYTAEADAVVFVVNAVQALTESERTVIDQDLGVFDHDNLYLVVNRIDQVDQDEVDEFRENVLRRVRDRWGLTGERVLFTDARGALRGRTEGAPGALAASGVPEFEENLERFLTEQRSRVKIIGASSEIRALAARARSTIDDLYTLMDQDLERLTEEYERQQIPLDRLWEERSGIDRTVRNHLEATRLMVVDAAERMLRSAAASCVEWAQEGDHESRVTLKFWKARSQAQARAQEVTEDLSGRIMAHVEHWRETELAALLDERATDLEEQIGERFVSFAENLESIRTSLLNAGDPDGGEHLPSTLSRITGVGVGLLLNPGALLVGSQLGFKEMAKTLVPQLAVAFGLSMLGFGPVMLAAAVFTTGFVNTLLKMDKLNDRIVRTTAESVAATLRAKVPELAADLAADVHRELDAHRQRVDRDLADSITEVRDQVQYALQQRDQAKEAADERRRRLAGHQRSLDSIQDRAARKVEEWAAAR
ncbi:dynamin family protein [Nocardiopsis sp. CC223A]|uniref:dynamin family protein n=1 Tax=Nocardiopsis sp. CC223A TaxID=3044051 RepID=UPI00278C34B3|nr:dynamin family protein [Nocardiopsis sp. CC223A]